MIINWGKRKKREGEGERRRDTRGDAVIEGKSLCSLFFFLLLCKRASSPSAYKRTQKEKKKGERERIKQRLGQQKKV